MIPRLMQPGSRPPATQAFLSELRQAGFEGDLEAGTGTRTVYATDNSIYQLPPSAVVFPAGVEDLKRIATLSNEMRFADLVFAVRGGGTGTNGQSLTDGIVIDMSRRMNRILAIDAERGVAIVETGVVKDQLNEALKPFGLFFAPELSTSNRATIGGMISTDACGQGSCIYGKTSDHVRALRVVLMDGTEWWSRPLEGESLAAMRQRDDRLGEIHRVADDIERRHRPEIDRIFPKLNRFLTGYDLKHLRTDGGGLDINAVLCGSEGTLAMIAEAELSLLPIPRFAALLNIAYDDFDAALRDARELAELKVASVETVDRKVLNLARGDLIWESVGRFFPDSGAEGLNIVEVLADDEPGIAAEIARVKAELARGGAGRRGLTVTETEADVGAIWAMRKRAVGLLGNVEGPRRPVAFVEDTAVPPEHLADFIAEFRALLDAEGLDYGMFGHVDAGVLHVRPALDLADPGEEEKVRRVTDAVVVLVRRYGGVLWGEHGKGVRSEYVPEFFGPLYPQLQRLKAAFDPDDRLNPGKIASAKGAPLTRIDELPFRGRADRRIAPAVRAGYGNAAHCNGNGACFTFETDSAMCPSFKGTGDRRQSPKGRASLMREWLGLLAENGVDPDAAASRARTRSWWRTIGPRIRNSLESGNDFSLEVKAAMDTCLACKACAGQCPVKVDVPTFRSRFLELYHGRYLRPPKDLLVANIEHLLPLMARFGPLYRLVGENPIARAVLKCLGLTALPRLARQSVAAGLRRRGVAYATPDRLRALTPAQRSEAVVFVQDAFTSHYEPELLFDAVDLAHRLGLRPFVAPLMPNGKALHVHGFLGRFGKTAADTAGRLRELQSSGVPLVGLDPSMTLTYRSEYAASLGKDQAPGVMMAQEWLAANADRLGRLAVGDAPHADRLLLHCSERTNVPRSIEDWGRVFAACGMDVAVEAAGCCGMAGTFGHETRNRALSERIYGLSWRSKIVSMPGEGAVMATGYSCRSQVKLVDGVRLPHPITILARAATRGGHGRYSQPS